MTTPGSFGHAVRHSDYKAMAEFMVLAGVPERWITLEDSFNYLYNDYIRLKREDDKRLEKLELFNSLEPGDIVEILGTGRIDDDSVGLESKVAYFMSPSNVRFEVTKVDPFGLIQVKWAPRDGSDDHKKQNRWSVHPNTIVSVKKADKSEFVERRINRTDRRASQDTVKSGSYTHVVKCLEAHNVLCGSLSEDQREVLADAQSKVRSDYTTNGFRKGLDRRKF